MKKETGIILKTFFEKKRKMIVLDRRVGKIECVPPSDGYCIGSVLEYSSVAKGSLYLLHEVQIIEVPLVAARIDINFMHHMLEICYFFMPFHQVIDEVYECIVHAYTHLPATDNELIKLAYLFKVVCLLGLHPEESVAQRRDLYWLAREPIDTIVNKTLDLEIKQAIDVWVRYSIQGHPLHTLFKTTY